MITSRSSKSSRVYYFSLIFCTHVLLISAYTTSVCGNHFSLFCCADINEKPSFGKHTGFFLMSTDSKRNTLKKSAHTAAGIFKENTFFFFFSIRVFIHKHWRFTEQQVKGNGNNFPLHHFYPLTNMETAGRKLQRARLCTQPVAELDPISLLSEVIFLTTEPHAHKENTAKFQRKVNPAWVINSIATNFFSFSQFGGQFYGEPFQHYFSCHNNHK